MPFLQLLNLFWCGSGWYSVERYFSVWRLRSFQLISRSLKFCFQLARWLCVWLLWQSRLYCFCFSRSVAFHQSFLCYSLQLTDFVGCLANVTPMKLFLRALFIPYVLLQFAPIYLLHGWIHLVYINDLFCDSSCSVLFRSSDWVRKKLSDHLLYRRSVLWCVCSVLSLSSDWRT